MGIPPLMPLGDFRAVRVTKIFIANKDTEKDHLFSYIIE